MIIEFKEDGESPDIGVFTKKMRCTMTVPMGRVFIERGLAIEIKPTTEKEIRRRDE